MKNLLVLGLFVILTFPAWKALRHPGMVSGHDSESAVFKSEEFYNALKDGHFPPRWAKRLNYGLGQPTFTFSYTLPYYFTSAIMATGFSAVWAYKILMAASFPAAGFFTYLWLRKRFGTASSILGGMLYALLPYHFVNVYARGAIGEVLAATLLPLTFWALDRKNSAKTALSITAVILAHPFYGLIFAPIWAGYTKFNKRMLLAIGWGYLNCLFYIVPAFWYKNLTYLNRVGEFLSEKSSFATLSQLIYSPWSYLGIDASGTTRTTVQIGLVVLILLFGFTAILLFRSRKYRQEENFQKARFFFLVFIISVLMMTRISLGVWKLIPVLRTLQFPWRLLFAATPAAVFCATYFFQFWQRKNSPVRQLFWAGILTVIVIVSVRNYAKVEKYYVWNDPAKETIGYRGTFTMLMEETPIWHDVYDEFNSLNKYSYTKTETGDFTVRNIRWNTNYHAYEVETPVGGILSDMTHYWPGWKVYIDGAETPLFDPFDPYSHGILTFKVPAGKHVVETKLTEPPINRVANAISFAGIGAAVLTMVRSKKGYDQRNVAADTDYDS